MKEEIKRYKTIMSGFSAEQTEEPHCAHFGTCGGCLYQDVPYAEQVEWKRKALSELFERDVPVTPSPEEYGYRTRMDYVAAFDKIGLRPRGRYSEVIDIEYCHLISEKSNAILQTVKKLRRESGIADYNYLQHRGFMRYAVLRQTGTGETMLIVVTKKPRDAREPDFMAMAEELAETCGLDSLWWIIHDGLSDLSYGEPYRFWNNRYIHEKVGGVEFLIGPNTFFQSNSRVAAESFSAIKGHISGESILDLYCGTGAISLSIHEGAKSVFGVESNGESIAIAKENAMRNNIANVDFLESDVRKFLISNDKRFDSVILDPPRSGAGKKVMKRVREIGAHQIVYMSCNPDTFRDDIAFLEGYTLKSLRGFDMFPQTPHVEMVAVLET